MLNSRGMWRKQSTVVCLLVVVAAASILTAAPTLVFGTPHGHNWLYNLSWLRGFAGGLHAGEWYPRWLSDLNGGAGSPVFFYYAPLPFYVSAIFGKLLCPGCGTSLHLAVGQALILCASGIAFYVLAREYGRPWVAAAGAVVYMAMPYHFEIDLWHRQAAGEFTAYVWTPLILHSGAVLLGIGLSGLYWVPALCAQDYIHAERLWKGDWFHYDNWFFFSGHDPPNPAFAGRLLVILLGVTGVCALSALAIFRAQKEQALRLVVPWLLGVALVWLMVTRFPLLSGRPFMSCKRSNSPGASSFLSTWQCR